MSGEVLTQRRKSAESGVVTQVRLGDVCRIDTSISFPCEEEIWLLNLDMIEQQTGRVIQRIYVDRNALGGSTVAFDENCVLYSKLRPNLNKVVLPDRKGVATSEILPLRCDADHATREFVCWFLRSPTFVSYAMNRTAGAKMPRLGTKELLNAKIPLPPLADQRRIATKLDLLCDIIAKRKQQLVQLQQLVKSRFVEMFGDLPNSKTLADVCLIITDGTHQSPKFVEKGIPFLFVSNIVTNRLTYDAEKFIDEATYSELIKRTPIEPGDILLSTVGSYGHPAIVQSDKRFLFQRHIAYLKPSKAVVDSVFLHSVILSSNVQEQIERKVKGIAQKTLNLSEIKTIAVPLPPLALQREFAAFVAKVDKLAFAVRKSLESAEKLYRQQLSEAFA